MKFLVKSTLVATLSFAAIVTPVATQAASTQASQIAVAKQAILTGEIMPYATPELRDLLRQAYRVDGQMRTPDNETGCEFYEHYYLGHGNKGLEGIKNWKATSKNNIVSITFNNTFDKPYDVDLVEFTMRGNQIDDVRNAYSNNPHIIPKLSRHDPSIKQNAQEMVRTGGC